MARPTHPPADTLSAAEARRIALAAQGLAGPRAHAADRPPGARHLKALAARLGVVQIDSVNVLARAHRMPFFSRLGAYADDHLERLAYGGRRRAWFEYWGHEASLLPVELQPLMRWRMARAERGEGVYGGIARFGRERRPFIDAVLAEVTARGPIGTSELAEGGRGKGPWWGWSDGKLALEWLFWTGRLTTATRRRFERVYDLTERVLPAAILDTPTPDEADAQRALLRIAAAALGVATESDLRDYYRLAPGDARARVAELVEAGELVPVSVAGWDRPAYLHPAARRPRRATAVALLSPFDPLVWERARTERLFGFRYRIEIYTPADRREYGYYVLPFLLGDRLAARLDLKADRATGRLLVPAAHAEPGAAHGPVAEALAGELALLAGWLGLERVVVEGRGDLAPALANALPKGGTAVPPPLPTATDPAPMPEPIHPGATLDAVTAADPAALGRLAAVHPVFADPAALPGAATLDEVAAALDLPVAVLLAAAGNAIHVTVTEGQGCGCSCGHGNHSSR